MTPFAAAMRDGSGGVFESCLMPVIAGVTVNLENVVSVAAAVLLEASSAMPLSSADAGLAMLAASRYV